MNKFAKILKLSFITALLIILPLFSFANVANSEEPILVIDKANIISNENEVNINAVTGKLSNLTKVPMYVLTVNSRLGESNTDVDIILEKLTKINAVVVIYYSGDGSFDIQTGTKIAQILTPEVVESIENDETIKAMLLDKPTEGIEYLSTIVADKVLVENGFKSVISLNEAKKKNVLSNKLFYVGIIVVVLSLLFITPISPYNKRKKKLTNTDEFPPSPPLGPMPPFTGGSN